MDCLNCGKPLGSRTSLCYECASSGVDPSDLVDIKEDVVDRLERYFVVSSLKCPDCGDVHGTVTVDGESHTAADFGIETAEEWELEMEKEEDWIRNNRAAVERAIVVLGDDWPETAAAVREHVL